MFNKFVYTQHLFEGNSSGGIILQLIDFVQLDERKKSIFFRNISI